MLWSSKKSVRPKGKDPIILVNYIQIPPRPDNVVSTGDSELPNLAIMILEFRTSQVIDSLVYSISC